MSIELNTSWLLFYGRRLSMSKQEILVTRVGEMMDMIACFAIQNGAKPKPKHRKLTFEETMEVI